MLANKNLKKNQINGKQLLATGLILLGIAFAPLVISTPVFADTPAPAPAAPAPVDFSKENECVAGDPNCIPQSKDPAAESTNLDCNDDGEAEEGCNLFTKYVNPIIRVLSGLAGLAVVVGLIWAGIQYASSGGDPQRAGAAKIGIRNALIALLFFIFLYAMLRFLIPGSVLGG